MGGKGQRRREKNYKAAHGGYAPLPPPPKPSDLDALPSKLRRIMDFTTPAPTKPPPSSEKKRKRDTDAGPSKTKLNSKDESVVTKSNARKVGGTDEKLITPTNEIADGGARDKKKAKRKKKQITDLRFEATDQVRGAAGSLKRRERKKKYLEAKKNKHKKTQMEDGLDFPGHEKIKFGDVVDAPPKLSAVPKGLKTVQDASRERLRLDAIEAYRNRKGWVSRPGLQLPSVMPN